MDWLKLVPIALNVGPDLQELGRVSSPLVRLGHKLWPDIEPPLRRILSNPDLKEFLSSLGGIEGVPTDPHEQMRWLQTALTNLGFPPIGGADGVFGVKTLDAILKLASFELARRGE